MNEQKTRTEEFRVSGDDLLGKVKEILREGQARNIALKNADGHTLIEVPLALGVPVAAGAVLLAPVWAAIGAIAALAADFTIVVEKDI